MLKQLDFKLFRKIFSVTQNCKTTANAVVHITNLSSTVFYCLYSFFILLLLIRTDNRIIPFILGPALGFVITRLLRKKCYRDRPFVTLEISSLISHDQDSSFPSMHSTSAFLIATSVLYISVPAGVISLILATITGISRIMVGVHYPADILTGALMGIFISTGTFTYLSILFL